MLHSFFRLTRLPALVLLVTFSGGRLAAAEETFSQPQASGGNDRQLSELFYQLQVLQQEVQELRGLVEEQAHQLNRLSRDQQEQYIDLDRRVAGLSAGSAVAGSSPATTGAGSNNGQQTNPGSTGGQTSTLQTQPGGTSAAASTTTSSTGIGERDAYQQAFDLMKARQFQESIVAFNNLIIGFPNGQFTPNAFYWLGELHLAEKDTELARQSFMQVVSLYPDHPKVPDTLYKLGVAYHRLGDTNRAMQYFGEVQSQFPQSSAAGLAASYATEIR